LLKNTNVKSQKLGILCKIFCAKNLIATRKSFCFVEPAKKQVYFFAAEIRIRFFKKVLGALHKNFLNLKLVCGFGAKIF
jgi:hypothetical protein